jgi:hypothetical protein
MTRGECIADLGGAVTQIEQLVEKMGGTVAFHFDITTMRPVADWSEIKLEIKFDPASLRKYLEKKTASSEAEE